MHRQHTRQGVVVEVVGRCQSAGNRQQALGGVVPEGRVAAPSCCTCGPAPLSTPFAPIPRPLDALSRARDTSAGRGRVRGGAVAPWRRGP